jgi:hypothetical protein
MRRLANVDAAGSYSNRARTRRFQEFERLVARVRAEVKRPVTVLDVGGTTSFWEQRGWAGRRDVRITTANLNEEPQRHANIEPRVSDATNLAEFEAGPFDVVFSNSVIEHLGSYEAQVAMATVVRQIAPRYWVQTPNFWFPIEPHFLTPGWQWLPESLRVALLRRRRWGWRGPCPDPEEARKAVREITLLRRRELERLFPDARLVAERFGPFVKSYVAVRDYPPGEAARG